MSPTLVLRTALVSALLGVSGCGSDGTAPGTIPVADSSLPDSSLPEGSSAEASADSLEAAPDSALADTDAPLEDREFLVGAGIYDVTGPAAEVGMMGYAMVDQKTAGLHTRLWSRAFVIASPRSGKRLAIVSADLLAVFQGVRQQVLERLKAQFGDLYTEDNVLLSGTHTHSGPGGFSHYTLYNLTILGYSPPNFAAIVDGIYQSILRAHNNLEPGTLRIAQGDLLDTTVNRSPTSYLANPEQERAQYAHDTDKTMTLLRLDSKDGTPLGVINWFGAHGTSMGNDNVLISGDNKGYASYRFERLKGTDYRAAKTFVAAFAQGSEGDSTPNIYGGTDGGGADDFESTALAGEKQLAKALELYDQATEYVSGDLDYRLRYRKMDEVSLTAEETDGTPHTTCLAAMGMSMIAGADDGPGFGTQGASCSQLADLITGLACIPTKTECQAEKPVVIEMGSKKPVPWTPEVLPFQIMRVGSLAIAAAPFEITTMSSRRLRATVAEQLSPVGVTRIVVAGPVNAFASYLTTREEFAVQRYEGASTHFGPWTLVAVQQQLREISSALAKGEAIDLGPLPRDLRNSQSTSLPGIAYDDTPSGKKFGDLEVDAEPSYAAGSNVEVVFWGGHPNNNYRRGDTFLKVEHKVGTEWVAVAQDWDWETKYHWKRGACLTPLGCSLITIQWQIPLDAAPGTYRIAHFGDYKSGLDQLVHAYEGKSREFEVTSP